MIYIRELLPQRQAAGESETSLFPPVKAARRSFTSPRTHGCFVQPREFRDPSLPLSVSLRVKYLLTIKPEEKT